MKRARFKQGSVVFDKRRGTWNLLQWIDGKRRSQRIGTKQEFPTKSAARKAAQPLQLVTEPAGAPTVTNLIEHYRTEKMPERFSTRYSYDQWLTNHIIPRWGASPITELQARKVELWLNELKLSPKSRVAIRGLLSILWDW
jgi:hypothetical protein